MTSHRRIRARNAGLDKVRRVTMRVAGGGLVLSGGIAALASATYAGTTHHRYVTYARPGAVTRTVPATNGVAPLTDPTLPPTTLAPSSTSGTSGVTRSTTPATSTPTYTPPTTAAFQPPQTTPQTQPTYQYTPPVVVTGGS